MERRLRVVTWNISGLCSDCKWKKVVELLAKHSIDIVTGQESLKKEDISGLGSHVAIKIVQEGKEGLAF